ncbi:MAG: hypothetical protein FWD69_07040 [Polyangiaceae bacterium]|nr:hypothetical protein [Polyangiaceae bacterium]
MHLSSRALGAFFVIISCGVAACAHDKPSFVVKAVPPSHVHVRAAEETPPVTPSPYIVGEFDFSDLNNPAMVIALSGSGNVGALSGRVRVILDHGQQRLAPELAPENLGGVSRIPKRFGGGFLFWTASTFDGTVKFYRSPTFDGALVPIASLPSAVVSVSFAPKSILVHMRDGQRWSFSPTTGERVAVDLPAVDGIAALDDGRVLASNSFGAVFSSLDAGVHWTEVTSQLRSTPERVAVINDELWLFESSGGAQRLEPSGHLSAFDQGPDEPKIQVRPVDPRWHDDFPPLFLAVLGGAALDENTALVVSHGDLVRLNVHTGEILSIAEGKFPPDATCSAVPTSKDILFVCDKPGKNGAFVVSLGTGSENPVVEQTFSDGGSFFASDDGGLAFNKPCGPSAPPANTSAACVRQPGGSWREYDLSRYRSDGGATRVKVARWVSRADGRAVAILTEPSPAIYDPQSGTLVPLALDAHAIELTGTGWMVDTSWSFSPSGTLRVWSDQMGSALEIAKDGSVTHSPYEFDGFVSSGPYGFGQKDGRYYQSRDHGVTWTPVAAPPFDAVLSGSCSSVGCNLGALDLGGVYMIGWPILPLPQAPNSTAGDAPDIGRVSPVEFSCRSSGPITSKVLARTKNSPDDLGLGAVRLPYAPPGAKTEYRRALLGFFRSTDSRKLIPSMLFGYRALEKNGVLEIRSPNRNVRDLRQTWSYVAPFDSLGVVRTTMISMNDVLAAAHAVGMTTEESLLRSPDGNVPIPLTSLDPLQMDDLVLADSRRLLVYARNAHGHPPPTPIHDGAVYSGVVLSDTERAFLKRDVDSGAWHAFQVGRAGVITDLFDVGGVLKTDGVYAIFPANPDALAMGPNADLGVIRTPSGSDPPSAMDPAMLYLSGQKPRVLAPWSTLTLATKEVCKRDTGYRATLQTIGPWVSMASSDLRVQDAAMLARVKWSEKRVCLEGLEVRLPDVPIPGPDGIERSEIKTKLVSLGNTFARVGVDEGIEWRQPLECSIVPR